MYSVFHDGNCKSIAPTGETGMDREMTTLMMIFIMQLKMMIVMPTIMLRTVKI